MSCEEAERWECQVHPITEDMYGMQFGRKSIELMMCVPLLGVCVDVCLGGSGFGGVCVCLGLYLELATSDIYHSRGQRVDGIFHRRLVSIDFR